MREHDLIQRYFAGRAPARPDVPVGMGDDGAVMAVPPGMMLVSVVDTLVSGVHFPADAPPAAIGHKALAVNLSDVAAMGAEPAWATLALTLPEVQDAWVAAFADGFFGLAQAHDVALVGGDTTQGPLAVTVQVHGLVPAGDALLRSGAGVGDGLYVTGTLGDAALGLALLQAPHDEPDLRDWLLNRLHYPQPRVAAGQVLRGVASAAIDISDGLLADLDHVCAASEAGARVQLASLPLSPAFDALATDGQRRQLPLSGGDDYELLVSVPVANEPRAAELMAGLDCGWTRIGEIVASRDVVCVDAGGRAVEAGARGYSHFQESE